NGEIYTLNTCMRYHKSYIQYPLTGNDLHFARIADIAKAIMIEKSKSMFCNLTINIAGNGIYSLSKEQSYYNELFADMWHFINVGGLLADVNFISGGQPGIDEASIYAANKMG